MNKDNNLKIWKEIIFHCYKASKLWTSHLKDYYNNKETDKKKSVLFSLSNRIGVNLHAVLELSAIAYKKEGLIYYKFPIGLLLRNCLIDSIIGLYVLKQDDKRVEELMELWNRDYVNALFEEFEVYRDKVSFSGFDDVFSEHMYTMALEDTFLHYMDLNPTTKEIKPLKERHIWKAIDSKVVCPSYNKEENASLKQIMKSLSGDPELGGLVCSLYAYYKYFSQYEHFSELGTGDATQDFGEDNIKFPRAFDYIEETLNKMLKNI